MTLSPLPPLDTDDPESSNILTPTTLGKRKKRPRSTQTASIERLETRLDHLQTDCLLIDVVLKSLQNFFPVEPIVTEEQLDKVDKELGIAHDDLLAQVRVLYRNVNKLDQAIRSFQSTLPP